MKLDYTDGTNQNWHNRPNLLKSKTDGDWASLLKCRMPLSISSSLPGSLYLFSRNLPRTLWKLHFKPPSVGRSDLSQGRLHDYKVSETSSKSLGGWQRGLGYRPNKGCSPQTLLIQHIPGSWSTLATICTPAKVEPHDYMYHIYMEYAVYLAIDRQRTIL